MDEQTDNNAVLRAKKRFMVVIVGHACSLKCKDCGNLDPYAPADTMVYSMPDIISNLDVVLSHLEIAQVQVQGGEPFLHKDLPDLIKYVTETRKKRLLIATNGTIMPKFDFSLLKNERITVRISDYPVVKNIGLQLMKELEKAGVQSRVYEFNTKKGRWYNKGGVDVPREDNDEIVSSRFENCDNKHCLTLDNGKLAHCSRGVISERIQGYSSLQTDYLTVEDTMDFRRSLYKYVKEKKFITACRYCLGTNESDTIEPALQLESFEGKTNKMEAQARWPGKLKNLLSRK